MSNDISYVVKVHDNFSKNNARLSKQIDDITKKIVNLDSQLKKIQGNLNINVRGGFIDSNAIIKPLNEIQQKLKEFSYGSSSTLGKIQRANEHIIKSNKELARSFGEVKDNIASSRQNPSKKQPNVAPAENNITLGNVARAMGFYKVVDKAAQLPGDLLQARREMDSLNASLEAILPQYDKTKTASQLAAEEFEYLTKTTYRLGVSFQAAKDEYVKFLAASAGKKDSLKDVRKQFEAFASLSRIYGIAPYRFGLIMNALTQMKSKGKISLEELQNQLGESLPGAVKIFSDALGMSEVQFRKLLSTTGISANVLKKVAESIFADTNKMNGLGKATNTLDARINRLNNSWEMLKLTLTEGDISELMGDAVAAIDTTLRGINAVLNALGKLYKLIKSNPTPDVAESASFGAANRFAFPTIDKANVASSQSNNNIPSPQEVNVKLTFENAPAGLKTDVSYPKNKGNLGVITEGY